MPKYQRLDATGLYYYGARYYDATIGRFISTDATIPNGMDPQSYNRYSYCINNPLSAIDPNGKDYVFVCGSGGKPEDWYPMIEALNVQEDVIFVCEDPTGALFGSTWGGLWGYEIQDQVAGLEWALANADTTDIKLIGHSDGAAAIITVLDKLADNPNYLGRDLTNELQAAITIEAPTTWGINNVVNGWDENHYNNLPADLPEYFPELNLLDIWNEASLAHSSCPMPGWDSSNTFSYNSASFSDFWSDGLIGLIGKYHNNPLTNQEVFDAMLDLIF